MRLEEVAFSEDHGSIPRTTRQLTTVTHSSWGSDTLTWTNMQEKHQCRQK